MLTLNIFTNFCEYWWLPWLLPLLFCLLGWWYLNNKWKNKYEELEDTSRRLRKRIADLEAELELCGKDKKRLKGDLALCEGRYRELELKLRDVRSQLDASKKMAVQTDVKNKLTLDATPQTVVDKGQDIVPPESAIGASVVSSLASNTDKGNGKDMSLDKYAKITDDNFQIIEGIGPKMDSLLKENGIHTFKELSSKSELELKTILNKYGDKYRIIDPSDWVSQATFASRRDFDGLMIHQKADGSESKAEKVFIKKGIIKAFKLNDLKAIEGIGPKIESLLNAAGINTWKALSDTSTDKLRSILEAAGARYKLADPSTWPKQAEYAALGDWDGLEQYQNFLDGGKTPS